MTDLVALADMTDLWREVLSLDTVGPEDDFFDLGGHSLLAVRLATLLQQRHGVDVPLDLLLKDPTPRGMVSAAGAG